MTASAALSLADLPAELNNTRSCLVGNPGNAGDSLIALGTYHYFDRQKVAPLTVFPLTNREAIKDFDLIVYSGGGNLVPYYPHAIHFIEYAIGLGKQVIVLPHTIFSREPALAKMASHLRLFCRERVSYDGLLANGFPSERLGLHHDMALSIDDDFFASIDRRASQPTVHCMRTDGESARGSKPLPPGNADISLSWNGDLWHNRQLVESVARSLAAFLVQYDTVITDRLHVAILAAMLGSKVQMHENSYFKNRAVYDFSLRERFPQINWMGARRRRSGQRGSQVIPVRTRGRT